MNRYNYIRLIEKRGAVLIEDALTTDVEALASQHAFITSIAWRRLKNNQVPTYISQSHIFGLRDLVEYTLRPDSHTVFIYPGRSAQGIHMSGFSGSHQALHIQAQRFWIPGQEPCVTVETLPFFMRTDIRQVIVVDDVISSGDTLCLLHERHQSFFPRANWCAAALVTRKLKLPHYQWIGAFAFMPSVGGLRAPINSISTLINNPEIQRSYLERNFMSRKCF